MNEELRKKLEAPELQEAIEELAKELRAEKLSPTKRFIVMLSEKVLVPIVVALITAFGIYYIELAKDAREEGAKGAVMELDRAAGARAFVLEHMDEVAPKKEKPTDDDVDVQTKRLAALWRTRKAADTVTNTIIKESKRDKQQVPIEHLRRELLLQHQRRLKDKK